MTKAQIWISAFLGLFLVLFAVGKFTANNSQTEEHGNSPMQQMQQTDENTNASASIEQVILQNCSRCHGSDLAGTPMAPSILNLKGKWNETELTEYLKNPASSSKVDHNAFPAIMPSFENLGVENLQQISTFLLK